MKSCREQEATLTGWDHRLLPRRAGVVGHPEVWTVTFRTVRKWALGGGNTGGNHGGGKRLVRVEDGGTSSGELG